MSRLPGSGRVCTVAGRPPYSVRLAGAAAPAPSKGSSCMARPPRGAVGRGPAMGALGQVITGTHGAVVKAYLYIRTCTFPQFFYHGVCCAVHKRLALSPGVHIERSNLYCAWDTSCSSTLHYRKRRAMPKMLDSQFNQPGVSDIPLSLTDCQVVGLPIGPSSVRCNRLHNSRGAPGLWPAPCIAPAM